MGPIDKMALALSDGIRLRILDLLATGRTDNCCSPTNPDAPVAICSCDLLPTLELAPSRLSYHMGQLKEAGLVSEQKRGRWIYYTLNRGALMEYAAALRMRFIERPVALTATTCGSADAAAGDVLPGAVGKPTRKVPRR
ncbi:MAG: ArsR/SmtB family transcription factor [Symbiobacteriia bacterium]